MGRPGWVSAILVLGAPLCSSFVTPPGPLIVGRSLLKAEAVGRFAEQAPSEATKRDYAVKAAGFPEPGPSWLTTERDSCGVGFIATAEGEATHECISLGLGALGCMEHRGACLADNISGDGSGMMTAIPWELLEAAYADLGVDMSALPDREHRGVGMVFLPRDGSMAAKCKQIIEEDFSKLSMTFHGWREVPVDQSPLGPQARDNQPLIMQFLVSSASSDQAELDRALYLIRRISAKRLEDAGLDWHNDMYFCSVGTRTIIYKGMTNANALGQFYTDLKDPRYKTNFVVYHRRFSTNTQPRWPLAQPMRMLGHNGEINTLLGNINWMRAREGGLAAECNLDDAENLQDFINFCDIQDDSLFEALVDNHKSDSANLDSVFELLVESGKDPMEALMVMVPEAYNSQPALADKPGVVDFYNFWEGQQEAWDGPALLVWSDGKKVGACLDRNGLRPARYLVTNDGMVCMMSETGVVPVKEADVVEKGRLGPGQMIVYDIEEGSFLHNWEIKQQMAAKRPYGEWVRAQQKVISPGSWSTERMHTDEELIRQQTAYGWSSEDVDMQIADMAGGGKETTFSMGDDIPLAVLSDRSHVLYDYFKQRFAQVTNPPIDPLREAVVMSVGVSLGPKGNIMFPEESDARQLKVDSPVLNDAQMQDIANSGFDVRTLSTLYPVSTGPKGLAAAVDALAKAAVEAVEAGAEVLVLSDKNDGGLSSDLAYIPPLLAAGAVHHGLIDAGQRMQASLITETAQAWSTHHFALLVGYGVSAVHPYMAFESIKAWHGSKRTAQLMSKGKLPAITIEKAQENFRTAIDAGLLKIMSKMGISLISSYQGAQIFEAIGIGEDLLQLGFKGTPSRLGGIKVADLAVEMAQFHEAAFGAEDGAKLANYGYVQFYRSGEYHHNSPILMKTLHKAIRSNEPDLYQLYVDSLQSRPVTTLRDLLTFGSDRESIPLEEVEDAMSIMSRFCTGGMSLGALSREAHETLAIGVNRIGGKSNSGEGGEDRMRFNLIQDVDDEGNSPSYPHLKGLKNGDSAASAIKQVASGRFGVTPEFLMSAQQLEIKVAQGAKPGEGGQLPGAKVDQYIAGLRASTPGVTLISPPPHHDIYSIEDLAQLIFDLHQINPDAGVSVKLVAEVGIGTIAAGVAKANADVIQISGHDGGTGASPLSSIKHAGSPWELGLAEVHRTLLQNGLRDRSLLRVDGGMKSGWDVVMAAAMGAEEFGFGTIAMIAEGCIMARICHTNGCPVGVTTQKEELRKKFPGTPDNVATFFGFVAEEVRMILAKLGYRSLDELIGRSDLLKQREDVTLKKSDALDVSFLVDLPKVKDPASRGWLDHGEVNSNGPVLDDDLLADARVQEALDSPGSGSVSLSNPIVNTDRAVAARVSGAIAKRWGNQGFAQRGGGINLGFKGSAGQSFAAFMLDGMHVSLEGEANDYVAKGINGGTLVICPPAEATFDASDNVIVGNTCLYGATGGKIFVNGRAGERFAVRNSNAQTVVEGTGDHCMEYMTGGVVVSIGPTGRNLGSGMTGGLGYFLDEEGDFATRVNTDIVKFDRIKSAAGAGQLQALIKEHVANTGSAKGREILDNWDTYLPKFYQVVPPSLSDSPLVVEAEEPVAALA